jgi:hypothetical protein
VILLRRRVRVDQQIERFLRRATDIDAAAVVRPGLPEPALAKSLPTESTLADDAIQKRSMP